MSGTVTVRYESDWLSTASDAEHDCQEGLSDAVDSVISDLESEGKSVVGGQSFSLDMDERSGSEGPEFRCSGEAEVSWVYEDDDWNSAAKHLDDRALVDDTIVSRFNQKHPPADDRVKLLRLRAVEGVLEILPPRSSIPVTGGRDTYVVSNPFDIERKFELEFKVETKESESYKVESKVSTAWDIKVEAKGKVFGGSAGVRREVSLTKTSEERSERAVTHTMRLPVTVQPRQNLRVTVSRAQIEEIYPLKGDVTFDGTIRSRKAMTEIVMGPIRGHLRRPIIVDDDLTLSSELAAPDRTFTIDGEIEIRSSQNTRTEIAFAEEPMPAELWGVGEPGVTRIPDTHQAD